MDTQSSQDQLAVVARQMRAQSGAFIAQLIEVTLAEIAELDHDDRMRALLAASITENIGVALDFLETGAQTGDLDAPIAALDYARTLAQRDVPLSALIRAYRFGHSRFLDASLELVPAVAGSDQMPLVLHLVRRSALYIDQVCEQVGRSYEAERDRWVSSRGSLRQQWVGRVLRGGEVDLRHAESQLSYRFSGTHIAAVAWPDAEVASLDVTQLFDDVRTVLRDALDALGPALLVPNDEREVHLWFQVRTDAEPSDRQLEAVLGAAGLRVSLALGRPETGVEGFRQSLAQAEKVQRIMAGAQPRPAVVAYARLAPVALMAEDMAATARFVRRALGDLAADTERAAVFRETLRVFLDHHRSYAGTAAVLTLHRNSVQYRVQRAIEMWGRSLDEPEVTFELQAALNAARWLGSRVLVDA